MQHQHHTVAILAMHYVITLSMQPTIPCPVYGNDDHCHGCDDAKINTGAKEGLHQKDKDQETYHSPD